MVNHFHAVIARLPVTGADVLTAGLKAAVSGMGLAIEAAEYLIA